MSIKTPKVKFGGDYKTAQIYSSGYEFAFMSQKTKRSAFEQVTPFVYCKDFLHDAIWAFLNKTNIEKWSFKYSYKKDKPLHMDRSVLCFRNTQFIKKPADFHTMMAPCMEFLHLCEEELGFENFTEIYEVEHEGGPCWLLVGDAGWQHAPTMISLYTLFIRLGCFHKPGDTLKKTLSCAEKGSIKIGSNSDYAGNNDCKYVKQGRAGIDVIFKHGLDVFHPKQIDNYPKTLKENGLHDNYGIVNFTARRPEKVVPHWYRKEIWGK
jgi:hypothetical protein